MQKSGRSCACHCSGGANYGGVKAEYKFNGWVLDGNGAKLYREGEQIPITKGLGNGSSTHTFQAKWEHLYTVVIDCNGGTITPGAGWTADGAGRYKKTGLEGNSRQSLPSNEPTLDGYEFAGWQIEGHAGKTYTRGESFNVDPSLASSYVITFKAVWEKAFDVKYAVSIYGIMQDTTQDGKKAALTFGPATGADYTGNGALTGKECGSANCIHKLTWSQIITKANSDPSVFQSCLNNGCTKSVELSFGDSPLKGSKTFPNMSGDGASILYFSLNQNYRKWNNASSNTGGWPASRIRTTLNGSDKCEGTDSSVAGTDLLTESQALISAFPDELRNAIVPKAVKSDIVYNNEDAGNVKTTYDKLWLFSGRELRTGDPANDIRKNESNVSTGYYQRASELGISTSSYANLKGHRESVSTHYWWLRSLYRDDSYRVYCVDSSGGRNDSNAGVAGSGVAPGFCLGKVQ